MGKQLLVDYTLFEISPQQINESLSKNGGRLVVSGVLQRAEAKNQNGRVYPKETLMREAKKYEDTFAPVDAVVSYKKAYVPAWFTFT